MFVFRRKCFSRHTVYLVSQPKGSVSPYVRGFKKIQNFGYNVLILLCLCSISLSAQTGAWQITGRVLDETGEPLPGATISADEKAQAISNAAGAFELRLAARPKFLTARCIGHFPQRIQTDTLQFTNQTTRLRITLISNAVDLPEVAISGKPVETVYEEDFTTDLLDYGFAGKDLLLLVRERKKYYLRLTTDGGDMLSQLQMPGNITLLHRSCTGDFHAVGADWAWEVSLNGKLVDTLPPYPAARFHQLVESCVLEKDGYYFFQSIGPFRQSVRYSYFDPGHKPHLLATIRDEVAEQQLLRRYREILSAYMKTIPDIDRDEILEGKSPLADPMQALNQNNLTKMAETNGLVAAIGFFSQLALDSVYAPLVKAGDYVYLLDHVNDQMTRIRVDPWEDGPRKMTYHHEPGWRKEVLVDAALNRVYGRFSGPGKVLQLKEINLGTGTVRKSYTLSAAPYLANTFRIRNGTLYCIGQPDVNVPNRKLYKMNIFRFAD